MASPSTAPPAKQGGGAAVVIGVILLLGLAGGLLWWKNRPDDTIKGTAPTASASATATAAPETTLDLPPIELPKDAGDTPETGPKTASTGGGSNSGSCPTTCTGQITDAIKAAAASRAGTAKKCYQTALEGNEGLAGEIVVLIRVGTGGETCSASVLSDSTGSGKLAQCVRSKMLGSYPQPKGGCVELKVPVVFKPKQ